MYYEAMGNILRIEKGAIAHCITADFSMGVGLAKQLDEKYHISEELRNTVIPQRCPICLPVKRGDLTIFNLVTKVDRYHQASYDCLTACIKQMKEYMIANNIDMVYAPQLGCGRDRLDWHRVKLTILNSFEREHRADIEILFYNQPKK